MGTISMWINGEACQASDGATFDRRNPLDGTVATTAPAASPADAAAVVEAIVAHPAVRRVNFTGSTRVGKLMAQTCAKYLKPVVRVANDNPYGLSAAVFGRDIARAWEVANRIDSGICHVNGPTVHDEAQMPFGGVKDTGYGRFGGKAGIDAFTELRWITVQTTERHYPF